MELFVFVQFTRAIVVNQNSELGCCNPVCLHYWIEENHVLGLLHRELKRANWHPVCFIISTPKIGNWLRSTILTSSTRIVCPMSKYTKPTDYVIMFMYIVSFKSTKLSWGTFEMTCPDFGNGRQPTAVGYKRYTGGFVPSQSSWNNVKEYRLLPHPCPVYRSRVNIMSSVEYWLN